VAERASDDLSRQGRLLSKTLKLVRGVRRLAARDVADRMGMPLRSYYSFEAGQGGLSLSKVWRFADATDSDPVAIALSLMLGSSDLAMRCMDNKAASILLASFRRFDERVGDRMTHIGAAALIEAFKRPFDNLEEYLEKRDQSTERWLAENLQKILPPDDA
jgi:transcriptional regulator with XRE-family HTH domain